jgi:hypothetical protein
MALTATTTAAQARADRPRRDLAGRRVKTPGGDPVYLIDPAGYRNYFDGNKIRVVAPSELAHIPDGHHWY